MLASRDQENLIHTHQTTAAGKPLNQAIRGLQPKTPGNRAPKTPFRVALNDENKPLAPNGQNTGFKPIAKGNENILLATQKDGKSNNGVFVTPTAPRTRAPLGAKTTNAKGRAFQTPAPAPQTIKPDKAQRPSTARKSVKSKIRIAPSEPVGSGLLGLEEDDVPDVEYAPPPPIELPDPPEMFDYDQTFPQFKGANICRGWGDIYLAEPKDEHGVPLSFKEYEEKCVRYDQNVERQLKESPDNVPDLDAELDKHVDAMIAAGPRCKPLEVVTVDTVRARRAANALSVTRVPSIAMKPTATLLQKSRKPTFSVLGSKNLPGPINPSPMRHTAAEVVSKNTIGFPRAARGPSIIPQKPKQTTKDAMILSKPLINQRDIHPTRFRELYGDPPEGSDMWVRLRQHELLTEEVGESDMAGDLFDTDFFPTEERDEEVFQLSIPS